VFRVRSGVDRALECATTRRVEAFFIAQRFFSRSGIYS